MKELFRTLIKQTYSDTFSQYYNQIYTELLYLMKHNNNNNNNNLFTEKQSVIASIQTNQFIYYPKKIHYLFSSNILYIPLKTYNVFNNYSNKEIYVFILNEKYIVYFIDNNRLCGYLFIRVLYGDEKQNQIIQKLQKQFIQQIYSLLNNIINIKCQFTNNSIYLGNNE